MTQGVGDDKDVYMNENDMGVLSYEMTNLRAYTNYTCSVQARSAAGLGKRSQQVAVVTATTGLLTHCVVVWVNTGK